MSAIWKETFSVRLPNRVESNNAKQLERILASQMREDKSASLTLALEDGHQQTVTLAPALTTALQDLLQLVSSGQGFEMIPVHSHLTTQQAADLLNVCRPNLLKLLEEGAISHTKEGRNRSIPAEEFFAFRERQRIERKRLLGEIMQFDQKHGLL